MPTVTKLLLGDRLRRPSGATVSSINTTDWDLDIDAQDTYKMTPLYKACSAGQEKIVKLLLSAHADPKIRRYSQSPLAVAIESKAERYSGTQGRQRRISIVKDLIQARADPETGKEVLRNRKNRKLPEDGMLLKVLEGRAEVPSLFSPSIKSFEVGESSSSTGSNDRSSTSIMSLEPLSFGPITLDDLSSRELPRSEK
ncbi:hypothetical protein M406DRAFT_322408 [Cryphonectria parasitica EP155]|uniref:Ankyrin repeat protein n=1 Tax=Cryphonectria parasitica (strain ATCC 38755 / EP155) TaxID=660469 RepID=A0A9P5CPH9_CRYP1|nr:uncharacterized protein M406DRAFT_322408 [Cryphonectria parasitica EP155]KAF3766504.1 hypothetical protein M406DRAFT_322408 [Cryphonectria parasitica EP155]